MRLSFPLSLFLLPASALQIPAIFADFYEAQIVNDTSIPIGHELLRRDGNCPANHNSCSTLAKNYGGACCTVGSACTTDKAKQIACCPIGATCTGTITLGTGTAAGGGIVFGGTTATATTSLGPAINTATTTTALLPTGTASFYPNVFFPFPYIPTNYANSVVCNSAYNACQSNYAACTNDLTGNSFAVTIVAPGGGGITVAPTAMNVGLASATSICSSLSGAACYNLQSADCAQFGAGTETGGQFIVATPTGFAARQTAGCLAAVGVMAALGIAGQML